MFLLTLQPDDLFVQTIDNVDVEVPPPAKKLKKSQCTPLFMAAYKIAGGSIYICSYQGCGNTMPDLSNMCYFPEDK